MEPLDNPEWQALTGPHTTVAEGGEFARRYRPEYSVWCAVHDDADPAAWAEMHAIVGAGGAALFSGFPTHPESWTVEREFRIRQLVLDHPIVAMAGERLQLPTAVEISGVCTAAQARGRGYAATLVVTVARQIQARGALPFLHVREANTDAIRLYERLGFRVRTVKDVALLRAPEA